MSRSTIQHRAIYLLIAMLLFFGSRGYAQATAADQGFKTIPQQIKTGAETKATNKANNVANSATDKLDSGVNKAYRGILNKFKKKPKPGAAPKDSTNVHRTDSLPGAPKTGFVPVQRRMNEMARRSNETLPKFRRRNGTGNVEVGPDFNDRIRC